MRPTLLRPRRECFVTIEEKTDEDNTKNLLVDRIGSCISHFVGYVGRHRDGEE